MARLVILVAALLGSSGVGMGAYCSHGLERNLVAQGLSGQALARRQANAETGVRYQMIHAVALLAVGAIALRRSSRFLAVAAGLWSLGVLLFSGGLTLHALTGQIGHWAIIPSGGVLLIAGWVSLALYALCGACDSNE